MIGVAAAALALWLLQLASKPARHVKPTDAAGDPAAVTPPTESAADTRAATVS